MRFSHIPCPNRILLVACFDPLNLVGSVTVNIPVTVPLKISHCQHTGDSATEDSHCQHTGDSQSLSNVRIPNRVLFLTGTVIFRHPPSRLSHHLTHVPVLSKTLRCFSSSRTFLHAVNIAFGEHSSSVARYAYKLIHS
jgi:hypothetical protein